MSDFEVVRTEGSYGTPLTPKQDAALDRIEAENKRLRRIEEAAKVVVGWYDAPGYDQSENEAAVGALRAALEEGKK